MGGGADQFQTTSLGLMIRPSALKSPQEGMMNIDAPKPGLVFERRGPAYRHVMERDVGIGDS